MPPTELPAQLAAAALQRIHEAERRAAHSAVPLYMGAGRHRTPNLIGTGFPIHVGERRLLLTASHVAACLKSEHFYIPSGADLRPFDCRIKRIGQSKVDRLQDGIDLAVIDLNKEQSERLFKYRFIQIGEMEFPAFANNPQTLYSFVGYPASKNKSKFQINQVAPTLTPFRGLPIDLDKYGKFDRPFETHLIVEFDEKSTLGSYGVLQVPLSPKGLSGGPVWLLGSIPEIINGATRPLLAGMAIENKRGGLIAVRTWILLQIVRALYPDLHEVVESFPGFKMNLPKSVPQRELLLYRQ